MANLTSVTLTAGVPTAGTGTVGTIDNVTGTAGSPSVPVLTVQGVASGTAQPVSGTVAATQSGTWTVQPGNTANTTAWKVDGSAVTQPVSLATNTPVIAAGTNTIGSVKLTDGTTALPILAASSGAPAATVPAIPVSIRDVNANISDGSAQTTTGHAGAPVVGIDPYSQYETVAASAAAQVMGATGAQYDYLAGVLVIPTTSAAGAVSITDGNGSAITVFAGGGTTALADLKPFLVPLGLHALAATTPGWKITTGTNVSAIGIGKFT